VWLKLKITGQRVKKHKFIEYVYLKLVSSFVALPTLLDNKQGSTSVNTKTLASIFHFFMACSHPQYPQGGGPRRV